MACHGESASPLWMFQKVRECLLNGLGAVLEREMGADSRIQSPGELCHTRL